MAPGQQPFGSDRLVEAYNRMLERIHDTVKQKGEEALPVLQKQIDHARETAVELGELTREEAEKIGEYLRRDTEEVARYLGETRQDFHDWFRFDMKLVEQRFLQMFELMVDRTQTELNRLADRAKGIEELHTGEVSAPGTLYCTSCGSELHFHKTGRIPPCPKCHATVYRRFPDESETASD